MNASSDCSIHHGDCVAWLRSLSPESVDLVVTDPAYESLEKHRLSTPKSTGVTKHRGRVPRLVEWFPIFKNGSFPDLFHEIYRVLRRNSHFYMFCDSETMFVAKPMAEAVGFKFWRPIVWDKRQIGMGYHYRSRCEFILFFEKGKRKLADLGVPDVLEASRIRTTKLHKAFPTEKPVELSTILISQSSSHGQLVIDPFMGSGSVGVAAQSLGRRFAGCDVDSRAIHESSKRLGVAV